MWILWVFAALAALAGAGFLWWRITVGKELALMRATETSRAADVGGKLPGAVVELKGTIRTDAPLTAEYSGGKCVYYKTQVEREVQRTKRDSNGRSRNERVFETESTAERNAPARLEDASGAVAIAFEGAKVEAVQVHRHYESSGVGLVGSLLNVSGTVLGRRYTEWAIEPDAQIYVLGTALAGGGVGQSPDKKAAFIISTKSEEQRIKSLGWTRIWLLVGMVIGFGAAIALAYFAVSG